MIPTDRDIDQWAHPHPPDSSAVFHPSRAQPISRTSPNTARVARTRQMNTSIAALAPARACRRYRIGIRNHVIRAANFDTPVYFIHGSVGSRLCGSRGPGGSCRSARRFRTIVRIISVTRGRLLKRSRRSALCSKWLITLLGERVQCLGQGAEALLLFPYPPRAPSGSRGGSGDASSTTRRTLNGERNSEREPHL